MTLPLQRAGGKLNVAAKVAAAVAEWLKPARSAKRPPMRMLTAKYGVSKQAVYRAIKRGAPAEKLGRPTALTRQEEEELAEYIIAQQQALRPVGTLAVTMQVRAPRFCPHMYTII
jgi:hypothetical protein